MCNYFNCIEIYHSKNVGGNIFSVVVGWVVDLGSRRQVPLMFFLLSILFCLCFFLLFAHLFYVNCFYCNTLHFFPCICVVFMAEVVRPSQHFFAPIRLMTLSRPMGCRLLMHKHLRLLLMLSVFVCVFVAASTCTNWLSISLQLSLSLSLFCLLNLYRVPREPLTFT